MRVLCGQCGQVHDLDEGDDRPTLKCTQCGHVITVPRFDETQAPVQESTELLPEVDFADFEEAAEVGFAEQARKTDARKIKLTCENCGKTVYVSARVAGRRGRCKACDHPMQIPYPDDLEEFKLPRVHRGSDEFETGLQLLPAGGAAEEADQPPDEAAAGEPAGAQAPRPRADDAAAALERVSQQKAEPAPEEALARAFEDLQGLTGGPASAEQEQLALAAGSYNGRRRAAKRSPLRWIVLLLAGVVAIALPVVILIPVLGVFGHTDANDPGVAAPATRPDKTPTHAAAGNPSTPKTTQPKTPAPKPKVPTCRVLGAARDVFACGGYLPAPAKSVYWKVGVEIAAGEGPLELANHGRDVTLTIAAATVQSLGEVVEKGVFPIRSRKGPIALKAGESVKTTLLFEVPRGSARGRMFVRGVAEVDVEPPPPAPPKAVAGKYVEAQPRNLQPMLRQPVMAAIQGAGQHSFVVAPASAGIEVSIPEAQVSGPAKPVATGLFQASLARSGRDDRLACTLRFLEGGRRMVLYLADEPFHQLTYVNPAVQARARPRPKPKPDVAVRSPKPKPKRRKPKDKPPKGPGLGETIWQEVPGYDPNAKPRKPERLPTGPSIFD